MKEEIVRFRLEKKDKERLWKTFENPSRAVREIVLARLAKEELPDSRTAEAFLLCKEELRRIGVNLNQIARHINAFEKEPLLPIDESLKAIPDLIRRLAELEKSMAKKMRGWNGR